MNGCIYIAASGTGGHLLPGIYIGKKIKSHSKYQVEFIGAGRPLEKLIDESGFIRHVFKTSGVSGLGIKGIIKFIALCPLTILSLLRLYKKQKPLAVVGVGGYVSILPTLVGKLFGAKVWIHEAEKKFGLANKVISLYADGVSSAFSKISDSNSKKIIFTGHPIREGLEKVIEKKEYKNPPKNILILGGSQGARALDKVMPEVCAKYNFSVVHQAREENVDAVKLAYKNLNVEAKVQSFIKDLNEYFIWADIIVSRAGAGSVMELSVVGKPCIFVPFPFAAGGHQKENAEELVSAGKAIVVEEGARFSERLNSAVESVMNGYERMFYAEFEPRSLKASELIAQNVIDLIAK